MLAVLYMEELEVYQVVQQLLPSILELLEILDGTVSSVFILPALGLRSTPFLSMTAKEGT